MSAPLLELRGLSRAYRLPRERLFAPAPELRALQDISLTLQAGRSLGVVGESGSGKSTLARAVMALDEPACRAGGQVLLDGQDLLSLAPAALRRARRDFQMVFQDPYGSLDPRRTVARIVAEPLVTLPALTAAAQRERVLASLAEVGLGAADLHKYPHEFSGGQRQRIAIARALVTRPRLIVADEPVSALDVSVQAQVLNLLAALRASHGLSYLLISHDLAVVGQVCDELIVLYRGRIVEQGAPEALYAGAAHPYTQALLAALPRAEPLAPGQRRARLPASSEPVQETSSTGCPYAARCPQADARCRAEAPALRTLVLPAAPGRRVACHHAEQILARTGAPRAPMEDS